MFFLLFFIFLLTLIPIFRYLYKNTQTTRELFYHQNTQTFQSFHSALEDYGQVHNDVQVALDGGEITGLRIWLGSTKEADTEKDVEINLDPFSETKETSLDNPYTAMLKFDVLQQRHDKSFRSMLTKPIIIDSSYFESGENSWSFEHLLKPGRVVLPGTVILIQRKYLSKTANTPNLLSFTTV